MGKSQLFLSILVLVGAGAASARGASIAVSNANFGNPTVTANSGYYQTGTPTSWTAVGFTAQYIENAANGGFASGTPGNLSNIQPGLSGPNYQYVADDGQGTLYQNLGVSFQPNTIYTVDLAGGHRATFNGNYTAFGLVSSTTTITTSDPGSSLAGATEGFINEDALPAGEFNYASAIGSPDAGDFTFQTGAVAPLGNVVAYIYNSASGRMEVSNFIVTTSPAPEPATLWILGLAASGLMARRRRPA